MRFVSLNNARACVRKLTLPILITFNLLSLVPDESNVYGSFLPVALAQSYLPSSPGNYDTLTSTLDIYTSGNMSASLKTDKMVDKEQVFKIRKVDEDDEPECNYSRDPDDESESFSSSGGTGSVSVFASSDCSWTATSNKSWITITSGSSGSGNGTVNYTVSENESTDEREGKIEINTETDEELEFKVEQSGATSCTYELSSTSAAFDSDGGTRSVSVEAPDDCSWTATSDVNWITIIPGSGGSGNGTVSYFVSENTSASSRTGTMTIAEETFTVTQSGKIDCSFSISPTSKTLDSSGGTGSVSVDSSPSSVNCTWTAVSNDTWITINSGSSGSGDGTVNYSVSENTIAGSRTGTMTIAGELFTITQSGTNINDNIAPAVIIDSPACGTFQIQVFKISGTASDDNIGVAKVDLQITDGEWYVDEGQNLTLTPTWITAGGTTSWSSDTSSVYWTSGSEYTISARATDMAGNLSSIETCSFTFVNWDTTLTINLSAQRILYGDTVDVSGKLKPLPDSGQDMEGLDITIDVTSPSGFTDSYTAITNEFGQYTRTGITGFDEEGSWTLQARFDGAQNIYNSSESVVNSLLVGESAGYAIVIEGKISNNEGIESHNKTTNRVYDKFIERNFDADDIYYFNYDTSQPQVDATPTKAAIQDVIENWARDKLYTSPAPLYIIKVNHGNIGMFHIDDEVITPSDLDSWLSNLESGLGAIKPEALGKKRIIILGHCYSGSFIPALSKEGRIVITSAAENEESYKGPDEPDGIRSGEFFIEELFKEFGRGYSLKESFKTATDRTEDYTQQNTGTTNAPNPYFDNSVQHPLLDDDGDLVGTNVITDGSEDGKEAANIIFGSGETYTNTGINPAEIVDLTETIYLGADETSALMWATVNDDSRVDAIWIEVRSPAKTISTTGSGVSEQLELDLPKTFLVYNLSTERYEANYIEFDSPGKWEIYYFVKDTQTGEISPMIRSTVYKDNAGNNPPSIFNLLSPEYGSEEKTILAFEWEASFDPDGDDITYNLLIATDAAFSNVVYRKEEITATAVIADNDAGLADITTYYWKAQAVDAYGLVTDSSQVWPFYTNNTNFGNGFITGKVYDDTNYAPIKGATIIADIGIAVSLDGGDYIMSVAAGTYTVMSSYNGYFDASFSGIRVDFGETTELNIPMTSSVIITDPAPDIKANGSDNTVTIGTRDTLSITVSLSAGDSSGANCDWWVAESAPDGWYYYSLSTSWTYAGSSYTNLFPTYQGALFDLGSYSVLNISGLPIGVYTFHFAIDTNMDGALDLDQIYFDSVVVNVQ